MTRQTVVISGGSSGIGLDLAKAYAQQGANLVLLARHEGRLHQAVEHCQGLAKTSEQVVCAYSVDVSDANALGQTVADIRQKLSAPDVLILSAGIVQSVRFLEQSDDDFADILNINVLGSRALAKAFLPDMIKAGKGSVCFVSSLGGLISTYGYSAYSASKFAVIGMAGALRQEVSEHGIGINVLCPPEVDTPMVAKESGHILPQTRFIKDVGGTLDVSTVTKAALKGISANRFIIVPGLMAKISYAQARFMPRIFAAFMQVLVNFAGRRAS